MKYATRLKFTTTGTSAASFADGTAVSECRNIARVIADGGSIVIGDTNVAFHTTDGTGKWEDSLYSIGGTASAPTLTRTQVLASSAGGTTPETFTGVTLTVFNGLSGKILSRVAIDRDVPFSQSVPLDQVGIAWMAPTTANSALAFTPAAGAVKGAFASCRVTGDGTNDVTAPGFKIMSGSSTYDKTAGTVNVFEFQYDGYDYMYAVAQRGTVAASDTTAPTASSAVVANATPSTVAIAMSEALDANYVPAASAFTVAGHTVLSVAISSSTINLSVSPAFVNGEAARTVAYTQPGTNNARDLAGNLLANLTGLAITNNVQAADTTAPAFSSAQVANATPTQIAITMGETLANSVPPANAFAVTGGKTVNNVVVSGVTVTLTVSAAYVNSDVITVSYAQPAANPRLQDAAGNLTASFGPATVTNNVGAAPTAPGAPTSVTATPGDGSASVTGTAPASNGGSAITGYTATATPAGGGTAITATSASLPLTVTGLTNNVAYNVTLHAINGVGPGPESTPAVSVTPTAAPAVDYPRVRSSDKSVTITESGTGPYTYTGTTGQSLSTEAGGLLTKSLAASADGYVEFFAPSLGDGGVKIGMRSINGPSASVQGGYLYTTGSPAYYRKSGGGNISAWASTDTLRFGRFGGVVKAQVKAAGASVFTDLWADSSLSPTAQLWIDVAPIGTCQMTLLAQSGLT